jgi:hypothetical protein
MLELQVCDAVGVERDETSQLGQQHFVELIAVADHQCVAVRRDQIEPRTESPVGPDLRVREAEQMFRVRKDGDPGRNSLDRRVDGPRTGPA